MKSALLQGLAALLFAAQASASDEVLAWRAWLELPGSTGPQAPVAFPSERELAPLRRNEAWLKRWASVPPSVAWNDVASELIVKYQQSPLRATRVFAYVHTAMHDALVHCARLGCEPAARPIAMHAAASRMLDHLYPDESRGRMEALGHSAAAAFLAARGRHPQAELAWSAGRAVADNAILRALDDAGWDGLYDIEIFSDDGTFGAAYPDSYWAAPGQQTIAQAVAAFDKCWSLTPQEVEEAR